MKTDNEGKGHSKHLFWAVAATIATTLGVIVALLAWQHPVPPPPPIAGTSSGLATQPSESSGASASAPARGLYLMDVDRKYFVKQAYTVERGPVAADGVDYPSSYHFAFENCSDCTSVTEFNLPANYTRFQGTLALSDETRTDDPYDGTAFFSISTGDGKVLLEPQKVTFPESIPFDISVTGHSRLRLIVSGGTNQEFPCWCDARFLP